MGTILHCVYYDDFSYEIKTIMLGIFVLYHITSRNTIVTFGLFAELISQKGDMTEEFSGVTVNDLPVFDRSGA